MTVDGSRPADSEKEPRFGVRSPQLEGKKTERKGGTRHEEAGGKQQEVSAEVFQTSRREAVRRGTKMHKRRNGKGKVPGTKTETELQSGEENWSVLIGKGEKEG